MNVALLLEYDGTAYHGFQVQRQQPTVQGELERAIHRLTNEQPRLHGASRTDAGAHAKGQVVSFTTSRPLPPSAFVGGLNRWLPSDIAVLGTAAVDDGFDARRSARWRTYDYLVLNQRRPAPLWRNRAAIVGGHLDEAAMAEAARRLEGEHDFSAFVGNATGRNTRRTVRQASVWRDGDTVGIEVVANAFLPRMMRNLAASLILVGGRQLDADGLADLLAGHRRWRGPTAPACGLYLIRVEYDQPIPWEPIQ